MTSRTMIYLEAEQLEALKNRARAERISVAELLRRVVKEYLARHSRARRASPDTYARLVGLGSSGRSDIARKHDRHLAEALRREHLR